MNVFLVDNLAKFVEQSTNILIKVNANDKIINMLYYHELYPLCHNLGINIQNVVGFRELRPTTIWMYKLKL